MEEENVVDETSSVTVEETEETPALDTTEELPEETPEVDVEQLQTTNKKLFERAKKAEAELKAAKASKPATATAPVPASPANVEETVLLANGMSEELLGELKAVAKARSMTSLIKAQTDPIFVAVKEKFEKDQKQKDASLGASRGAGAVKVKKDPNTPGLTRDEHKEMVKSLS